MLAALDQTRGKLDSGEFLLLVYAQDGYVRRGIHGWADTYGYQHKSIKTDLLDPVHLYKCFVCDHVYTESQLGTYYEDVGKVGFVYCKECNNTYDFTYYDKDYNDLKPLGRGTNAVLVGLNLPKLSKWEVGKKNKGVQERDPDDIKFLKSIQLSKYEQRGVMVLPRSQYERNYVSKDGKEYPRVRDCNTHPE